MTLDRVHEARWGRKCGIKADPHAEAEVAAFHRMAHGSAKNIARHCGVSVSRIHNMMAGDQPSFLTQLRRSIEASIEDRKHPDDYSAPTEYLCDRFMVRVPHSVKHPQIRLVHSASLALDRAAEAIQVAVAAAADGKVDEGELQEFEQFESMVLRQFAVLRMVMQKEAGAPTRLEAAR